MIDQSTEFGQRALQRLNSEYVIWLTTVRRDGTPFPSPVWYVWDGDTILVYSRADAPKVRNILQNSNVALHFDSDGDGGNIVVFTGRAEVDDHAGLSSQHEAYQAKYREGIANLGMTVDGFATAYSTAIRITLTTVRGH